MLDGEGLVSGNTLQVFLKNTTINQVLISPPDNFSRPFGHWPTWKSRFMRYLRVANLSAKPEAEKIDILCYTMGEDSERIIQQIMPDTNDKSLADVLQAFTKYFDPTVNVAFERLRFTSRKQQPTESVDQFITALYTLAKSCQYGNMEDELIRDQIVVGLSDTETSEKLRLKPDLTLENAITMAHQAAPQCSQHQVDPDLSLPGTICFTAEKNVDQFETSETISDEKSVDINSKGGACSKHGNCKEIGDSKIASDENAGMKETDDTISKEANASSDSKEEGSLKEIGDLEIKSGSDSVNCIIDHEKDQKSTEEDKTECDMGYDIPQSVAEEANKDVPAVVHPEIVSMIDEVELRKAENALRVARIKSGNASMEDLTIEVLYDSVRRLLNKLSPQNFAKSANRIKALKIDSYEKLQGVVDLVFEKAVSEPNFLELYAFMCKELAMMQVSGLDSQAGNKESIVNFRKLIITRCQREFEKNTVDKNARAMKMREIETCMDPEKQKELQQALTEEEKQIRIKSADNIRFIGELFKQGMLTTNIMHRCIRHLLTQIDEESLECLCKLLSTIGKDLESKNQNLRPYFKQMLDIVSCKEPGKVSSRVRFMLQDVIELRMNKWIPEKYDGKKEAETGQLNRDIATKRNRKLGRGRQQYSVETSERKNKPPSMDNLQLGNKNLFSWSRNVSADAPKTVTPNEFAMLENTSSEQDKRSALPLSGSRSTGPRDHGREDYKSFYDGRDSRNGSPELSSRSLSRDSSLHDSSQTQSMSMPLPHPIKSIPLTAPAAAPSKPASTMSKEQLAKKSANILEEYLSDTNISNAALEVRETFDNSTFANFVREVLNGVIEKSVTARKQVSQLMTHLISKNILPLSLYLTGLADVLEMAEDLEIDIPKIWVYLAELIWYPLAEGVHPFSELKTTMAPLKSKGLAGKLMGELMITLVQEKSPKWIKEKWDEAGLDWRDFLQENESLTDFIKKYKLELLFGDSSSSFGSLSGQLSMEQIHDRLLGLMSNEKENSFDNICSWISANVGARATEPQFVKVLMTAILEVSIVCLNNTWGLIPYKFENLKTLIPRYVKANVELLELQCLIAIQEYIHRLEHPAAIRVLVRIFEHLKLCNLISTNAFLAWKSNKDPTSIAGKSVAMMALTSFFTWLEEAEGESSSK